MSDFHKHRNYYDNNTITYKTIVLHQYSIRNIHLVFYLENSIIFCCDTSCLVCGIISKNCNANTHLNSEMFSVLSYWNFELSIWTIMISKLQKQLIRYLGIYGRELASICISHTKDINHAITKINKHNNITFS